MPGKHWSVVSREQTICWLENRAKLFSLATRDTWLWEDHPVFHYCRSRCPFLSTECRGWYAFSVWFSCLTVLFRFQWYRQAKQRENDTLTYYATFHRHWNTAAPISVTLRILCERPATTYHWRSSGNSKRAGPGLPNSISKYWRLGRMHWEARTPLDFEFDRCMEAGGAYSSDKQKRGRHWRNSQPDRTEQNLHSEYPRQQWHPDLRSKKTK